MIYVWILSLFSQKNWADTRVARLTNIFLHKIRKKKMSLGWDILLGSNGGISGNLSFLFSKASFINYSHSFDSHILKTWGALSHRHFSAIALGDLPGHAAGYCSSAVIPQQRGGHGRALLGEVLLGLLYLSLSHKLSADSFLAFVISGIHHFYWKNRFLCRSCLCLW